ncbi:MAG: hydroxymethylglutaryl-CoA synthase [Fervidicoccaceae archaeon]
MDGGLPESRVGIAGWGTYVPRLRVRAEEFARVWGHPPGGWLGLGVSEKSLAWIDEDAVTMGVEAALGALARACIEGREVGAVFFGTESKPYAVKPSAAVVAEALGITPHTMASDLEFACRAASEGLRASIGLVASNMVKYSLVIGSDTAQANPGDVLEFTASSAAVAILVGPAESSAAIFEASHSYVTDTTDFWRRSTALFPLHAEGFTGEPAYFAHIIGAVRGLLEKTGLRPGDFDFVVFHQPNARFPLRVAERLGFPREKVEPGLVVSRIGNSYNASALMGLARILEIAEPGSRILLAPFGSGAGADAYSIVLTERARRAREAAPKVDDWLSKGVVVDYAVYARARGLLRRVRW